MKGCLGSTASMLLVLVGMIACFVLGSTFGFWLARDRPIEAAAAPVVLAADTPTAVALPASTPEPATAVPMPTDTPLPTVVPQPDGALTVEEYVRATGEETSAISAAMKTYAELATDPEMGSDDWKLEMVFVIATVRVAHDRLTEIVPPLELQQVHGALLDGTSDCSEGMGLVAVGIDNLDKSAIDRSTELLISCDEKIGNAAQLLKGQE